MERLKSIKSIVLKEKLWFANFNLESISLKCMVVTDDNLTSIAENFPLFKDLSLLRDVGIVE